MQDIGTLKRLRDDLNTVIKRMEALETGKARTHPVVVEIKVSNSLLNETLISFSSVAIDPSLIVPEAPIVLDIPQIKVRCKTRIAAQYRLTSRSEIGQFVDDLQPTKNDFIRLALMPDNVWQLSIRKGKTAPATATK